MNTKRLLLFAATTMMAVSVFSQKKGAVNQIKTESDTISYSYGLSLTQQGLLQHLHQNKLLSDTATVRASFQFQIDTETDEVKKKALIKTLKFKIDSTNIANNKNSLEFLKGITEMLKPSKKVSPAYAEGLSVGSQLSKMIPQFEEQFLTGTDKVNINLFLAGMESTFTNKTPLVDDAMAIMNAKMEAKTKEAESLQESATKEKYAEIIASGNLFMEENKMKEGVVVLPSGLQYKVITQGNGEKPSFSDKVKVHYHGTLLDGEVFDSSVDRGEPVSFGVGQVIQGWTEALQLMPVGSKWILYIPYDLAYGAREMGGGPIKPYSNLIFEVELLDIEK